MKNSYTKPEMELLTVSSADVISCSPIVTPPDEFE